MKKFKSDRKLEQATVSFIVNQLISKEEVEILKKARYDHFLYVNSFFSVYAKASIICGDVNWNFSHFS